MWKRVKEWLCKDLFNHKWTHPELGTYIAERRCLLCGKIQYGTIVEKQDRGAWIKFYGHDGPTCWY